MTAVTAGPALPVPFRSGPFTVRAEWIDENGHLNLAHYITLFDWATDALWQEFGLGAPFRATGRGTFAVETHTLYRAELLEGEAVVIDSQVLGVDAKRLHVAHTMRRVRDDVVSSLQELMYLGVDLSTRRVSPWPETTARSLRAAAEAHALAARPDWVGRSLALPG